MAIEDIIRQAKACPPDVLLVGEIHFVEQDGIEQARLIRTLRPEFVLYEGFDDTTPEQNLGLVDVYRNVTLDEICGYTKSSPGEIGIDENFVSSIIWEAKTQGEKYVKHRMEYGKSRKEAEKEFQSIDNPGVIPENYDEFMNTPFYKFTLGMQIDVLNHISSLESDNKKVDLMYQYLDHFLRPGISDRSKDHFMRAVAKTNCKVAGCDIKKELPSANLGSATSCEDVAKHMEEHDKYIQDFVENTRDIREEVMGKTIAKYVKKRKTRVPVMAVVGMAHLSRDESPLYKELNKEGISYVVKIQEHVPTGEDLTAHRFSMMR